MIATFPDDAVQAARLMARRIKSRRNAGPRPSALERYMFDPVAYVRDKLLWAPWGGTEEEPGQIEVFDAYALALRQQIERRDFEAGLISEAELTCYEPGQVVQNRIRIASGHTIGKTKMASGMVNHFFDCFTPSIIYTFAPSWDQIHDLLWKEIKADRQDKGLPGRILDLGLSIGHDHFAKGRAASNAQGTGSERVQGQHGPFIMMVLDEAEGIADFVWDAIDSMVSGGVCIVVMLANPKTRSSRFHKARLQPDTVNFRISETWHPNVLQDKEIVSGAVRRDYVERMLGAHAALVEEHSEDDQTFELPWRPGEIYKPDSEFMFRVLGVAPANTADDTVMPVGRYEAAVGRASVENNPRYARMGVDVARFGRDMGTLYLRHNGLVRRVAQFAQVDTVGYAARIVREAKLLAAQGVSSLHIRVDGGGGFGGGVIDQLAHDYEFCQMFGDLLIVEVHFNGEPFDQHKYANLVTEMYFEAAESIKALGLVDPPRELEDDLCARLFKPMNRKAISVNALEEKVDFRKRMFRSPDDGDGFVLAVAPDHIFHRVQEAIVDDEEYSISPY